MILLLDTSTAVCKLSIVHDSRRVDSSWDANRDLAKGLLLFIKDFLSEQGGDLYSLTGLGVMRGPGSFTGLRIGITVMNTLADSLSIPIVGKIGDSWQEEVLESLSRGQDDRLVVPFYDQEANITKPTR